MNSSTTISPRGAMSSVLKGLANPVFAIAGMLFFFGGRAIHEFLNVDRFLAEMVGIFLTLVFGLIAVLLNAAADRMEDPNINEPVSLALSNSKDTPQPNDHR